MDLKIIIIIVLAILVIVIPIIVSIQVTNTVKNNAYIYNFDDIIQAVSTKNASLTIYAEGNLTTDGLNNKTNTGSKAIVYTMTSDVIPFDEGLIMDKVLINNPNGYSIKCGV